MANRPESATLALGRLFIEKFGYQEITIEKFDLFIIDSRMATDPETEDTTDPRWMKFIGERSAARKKLNRAGPWGETTFMIDILIPGLKYNIVSYADGVQDFAQDVGERVRTFTTNKRKELQSAGKPLKTLMDEQIAMHGHLLDPQLEEAYHMVSYMSQEAIALESKIKGLVYQYNVAGEAVHERVQNLLERYSGENVAPLVPNLPALEQDAAN